MSTFAPLPDITACLPITQGVMNIDEKSMYNILQMAKQEMSEVVEPPLKAIDENISNHVYVQCKI